MREPGFLPPLPDYGAEVHVWSVRLDEDAAALAEFAQLLAEDERERAARLRFERDRRAFVLARGALRILLGAYAGEPPAEIAFAYGAAGKPRLASGAPLDFNVSHSGGFALFAFARDCELGLDVEAVRPVERLDEIAERFFCTEERQELRALSAAERELAFFRCWTRKEAFIKATGEGLSAPLDRFRVTLRPGEAARLLHVGGDRGQARAWTMHDLALGTAYAGALAYRKPPLTLRMMPGRSAAALLQRLS
ncbi:MAG: 4'-phosphopantetheinyl transferase superfamily protein [Candidatus Baltobacteraceae bacterium]|jgi:4'-phosphopantetheinyl transferase